MAPALRDFVRKHCKQLARHLPQRAVARVCSTGMGIRTRGGTDTAWTFEPAPLARGARAAARGRLGRHAEAARAVSDQSVLVADQAGPAQGGGAQARRPVRRRALQVVLLPRLVGRSRGALRRVSRRHGRGRDGVRAGDAARTSRSSARRCSIAPPARTWPRACRCRRRCSSAISSTCTNSSACCATRRCWSARASTRS